ncbi:MAG: serine/threonine protein kinase [Candidatus Sericytochromatia bacterium]
MASFEIGSLIASRYQLEACLQQRPGQITWRARDTETQTDVILKGLDLGSMPDWEALKLFEREIQTLQTLAHPQIPRLLNHFQSDARHYLVMQALPGTSLQTQLAQNGPLTEAEAQELARQLLEILVYLHQFSPPVIHRDIKPSNILRDSQNTAFLIDFGAVKDLASTRHTVVGTFGYMAPEQLAGHTVAASDLYALGVTLACALSGLGPEALPREGLQLLPQRVVTLSSGFATWLQDLLSPELSLRFSSAQQALSDLQALNDLQVLSKGTAPLTETPPRTRLKPLAPQGNTREIDIGASRRMGDYLWVLVLPPVLGMLQVIAAVGATYALMGMLHITLEEVLPSYFHGWPPWVQLVQQGFEHNLWQVVLTGWALLTLFHLLAEFRACLGGFQLRFQGSELICLRGKREKWRCDLTHLQKTFSRSQWLQFVVHKGLRAKLYRMPVRLQPAEQIYIKNLCREHLRQQLSPQTYQRVLQVLKQ